MLPRAPTQLEIRLRSDPEKDSGNIRLAKTDSELAGYSRDSLPVPQPYLVREFEAAR
jgi:hypothetical protein